MTLSTVTYLFKERNLNFHGMSNTRRHKLSPLQKNLSNFLYITDLDETIQKTQLIYIDKIYTNNKIDPDLHKNIYNIHKSNYKNYLLLKEDIRTIKNYLPDQSDTNIEIQSQKKTTKKEEFNLNKFKYLNNKLLNLNEHSMSPKVILFLLRNQIFSLEIEKENLKLEKDSTKEDYLSKYNRIKFEVDKLIKEQSNIENNHNIIDTLQSRIKNLELEKSNLEKIVEDERTEINKNRIKKEETETKINWAKSKKVIKKLKKETGYTELLLENERINQKINLQEQQIKKIKLNKQNVLNELDQENKSKNTILENSKKEIEKKQQELDASSLEIIKLRNSTKVLDKLSEKLDLINNFSFSTDLVKTINNRNRNKNNSLNSLNKYKKDFVSNNNNNNER